LLTGTVSKKMKISLVNCVITTTIFLSIAWGKYFIIKTKDIPNKHITSVGPPPPPPTKSPQSRYDLYRSRDYYVSPPPTECPRPPREPTECPRPQNNVCTVKPLDTTIEAPEVAYIRPCPEDITKNKQLTELPFIGKQFSVSFEVKMTAAGKINEYFEILHLTKGGNMEKDGDRIPGIWERLGKLEVRSSVSGDKNLGEGGHPLAPPLLKLNEWNKVVVSQIKKYDKFTFKVTLNGVSVWSVENTDAKKFSKVKVFACSEWYEPVAGGQIQNLQITTTAE